MEADDVYEYISHLRIFTQPIGGKETVNEACSCSNGETMLASEAALSIKCSKSTFYFVGHGKEYV